MTLQEKIQNIPNQPGVYIMKNAEGRVIYVGKAISLKNRVRSYFNTKNTDSAKTRALVRNIRDLEYILTDTELEALILECNLIKEHRPKYNIDLKDDKSYPYLRITNERFPRVFITRKLVKDGSKYFGPYTAITNLRETVELLQKLFLFRNCNQTLFNAARPCLNAHIARCSAPCAGKISEEEYQNNIKQIILFLEGKQEFLVQKLEKDMRAASARLDFEKAALIRDQIQSIRQVMEKQKIVSDDKGDQDVLAMARGINEACLQVFFIRGGKIIGRENYFLQGTDELARAEIIQGFIKQYYNSENYIPNKILVETELPEEEVLEQWLTAKRGNRVYLKVPKRGSAKELVDLVAKNALEALNKADLERQYKKAVLEDALIQLQKELSLENIPTRIECYDISNIQGADSVGSMVVFEEGKPKKDQYRRFKIKTVEGPNDFASIYEVVSRRLKRATEGKEGFARLPNLIIIDGGKGQLEYALRALSEQGYADIPIYGLTEKEEILVGLGKNNQIILPRSSQALFLLQRIRDEAHRFALNYHRSLRGKRNLASILNDIPGIGIKRREILLLHFGSFKKICEASMQELMAVPGISFTIAEEIYDYLRNHQDLKLRRGKKEN